MNRFHKALRDRLPGGLVLSNLLYSASDFRFGMKTAVIRFLIQLTIYFFGTRFVPNKAIAVVKQPYPTFYHYTPEENTESIKEKGLLPNHGNVWITDWTDDRWIKWISERFGNRPVAGFRIDTERLIASGHKVHVMQRCHEFTTDHVPPDCLQEEMGTDQLNR